MAFAGGFGGGGVCGEIPVTGTLTDSVQSLQWSPTANHLCAAGWNGEVSENISLSPFAKICGVPFPVWLIVPTKRLCNDARSSFSTLGRALNNAP